MVIISGKIFVHGDLRPISNPNDDNGICPLIRLYSLLMFFKNLLFQYIRCFF